MDGEMKRLLLVGLTRKMLLRKQFYEKKHLILFYFFKIYKTH